MPSSENAQFAVANVVRLCHELQRKGKQVTGVSRMVLFDTTERVQLFDRLESYTRTYNELHGFLRQHYPQHSSIGPRIKAMPGIRFQTFGLGLLDGAVSGVGIWIWSTIVLLLLLPLLLLLGPIMLVVAPLGVLHFLLLLDYLKRTQRKIHRANRLLGSIAFILKAEERNAVETAA